MKIPLVLFVVWLLAVVPLALAQENGTALVREMSVNVDVQDKFYAKYPDLNDERDVVTGALRRLSPQETARMNVDEAEALLAERARTILALRTPQEWQRKAVSLYPELGVADSEFNQLFLQRYRELERTSPQFQNEPSWPVLLAKRCADELQARRQPKKIADTGPSASAPSSVTPKTEGTNPAFSSRFGRGFAVLSVLALGAILWLPAGRLFRISHAFGRYDESVTLWQRALRPATWTYLAVACIALFKTFAANADQTLGDRFGITLLVSLLAGMVTFVPAFMIAWGLVCWRHRAASHAEKIGRDTVKPSIDAHQIVTK